VTHMIRQSNDVIIQHMGAAVLLCWHELPTAAQERILLQAEDVIGIAPTGAIRDQILRLVERRLPR
jgi:hypothetical protein